MAMGKRTSKQAPMFAAATELPVSPGHPFYAKLKTLSAYHKAEIEK